MEDGAQTSQSQQQQGSDGILLVLPRVNDHIPPTVQIFEAQGFNLFSR